MRTMGFVTKVDRDDNSDRAFVLYVENAKTVCGLEWHVLTYRSNSDPDTNRTVADTPRAQEEKELHQTKILPKEGRTD
jgi:hypothetical protein